MTYSADTETIKELIRIAGDAIDRGHELASDDNDPVISQLDKDLALVVNNIQVTSE